MRARTRGVVLSMVWLASCGGGCPGKATEDEIAPDAYLTGAEEELDELGFALSSADIDGDGVAEIFSTAPGSSATVAMSLNQIDDVSFTLTTLGVLVGEDGDRAGEAVAVCPSLLGEGSALVMGAPGAASAGTALFLLDVEEANGDVDLTESALLVSSNTGEAGSALACTMSAAGLPLLSVSSLGSDTVFLLEGAMDSDLVLEDNADAQIDVNDGKLGEAQTFGDLDGDGIDDLIVSATAGETHGDRVALLSGPFDGVLDLDGDATGVWDPDPGVTSLGAALSAGHDLDDDGTVDLLIGAPDAAKVYAVLTSEGVDALGGNVWEGSVDSQLGASVTTSEDIDDDGIPDVLLGAPGGDDVFGAVYVQSGADRGLVPVPTPEPPVLTKPCTGIVIIDPTEYLGAGFGKSLLTISYADLTTSLIIGASGAYGGAGATYTYACAPP